MGDTVVYVKNTWRAGRRNICECSYIHPTVSMNGFIILTIFMNTWRNNQGLVFEWSPLVLFQPTRGENVLRQFEIAEVTLKHNLVSTIRLCVPVFRPHTYVPGTWYGLAQRWGVLVNKNITAEAAPTVSGGLHSIIFIVRALWPTQQTDSRYMVSYLVRPTSDKISLQMLRYYKGASSA